VISNRLRVEKKEPVRRELRRKKKGEGTSPGKKEKSRWKKRNWRLRN
jgi:hypothetical protein